MIREALTNELPAVGIALCIECRELTNAPVPIRWIQSVSGPGTTLYACPGHAVDLIPGPMPGELDQVV